MKTRRWLKTCTIAFGISAIAATPIVILSSCNWNSTKPSIQEVTQEVDKFLDETPIEKLFSIVPSINNDNELVVEKYFDKYYGYPDNNFFGLEIPNDWKEKTHITKDDFRQANLNPLFIDRFCLKECKNLEWIEFPDSVIWISSKIKTPKPLTIKNIPKNLRFFGAQKNQTYNHGAYGIKLELDPTIELPETLRFIGDEVLQGTVFRKSYMELPKKIRYIGQSVFSAIRPNPEITFNKFVLPDSLEVINNSFSNYEFSTELQSILLPRKFKYLGGFSFIGLKTPDTTKKITIDFRFIPKENFRTIFPVDNIFKLGVKSNIAIDFGKPNDFKDNPDSKFEYTLKPIISEVNDFNLYKLSNFEFWLPKHQQDRIENPKYQNEQKVQVFNPIKYFDV